MESGLSFTFELYCRNDAENEGSDSAATRSSKQLSRVAEVTTSAALKVSESVRTVVQGSDAQYDGANQTCNTMEEMAGGIQRIAESASIVSDTTQQGLTLVKRGHQEIHSTMLQTNLLSLPID
ncbi:hypothetical protein [Paenibacillus assamensis]|uniref:hypothetical protein n=1 Tax=Paenibacillus assamensis TaxID=311244 RepID=UPI0003F8ACB1|nr:hypothetical protein [Paenibacillus assamensis]